MRQSIYKPSLIIPNEGLLAQINLLKIDGIAKELNKPNQRCWQILIVPKKHKLYLISDFYHRYTKRYNFYTEQESLEFWEEIHTPGYQDKYLDPSLDYDYHFVITTFLTTPTGSTDTYNVPTTWSLNNFVDVIGGGGSGADTGANPPAQTAKGGGGGGAFSRETAINLVRGGTATFQVAAIAGDGWFNGANLAASSVGAKGGNNSTGSSPGDGGQTTGGIGSLKRPGGSGGTGINDSSGGAGGGGAAGFDASGGIGLDRKGGGAGPDTRGGNGGVSGDGALGGTGGDTNLNGNNGNNGTFYDATHGSGSGGGGAGLVSDGNPSSSGVGGNYGGAGAGGAATSVTPGGTCTGGTGKQGLIVVAYTPYERTQIRGQFI